MVRQLALAWFALIPVFAVAHADVFAIGLPTIEPPWTGTVSLQFVPVGDPGNAADTTGYGAVDYSYQMGKYDVTVGQYVRFLNAVAKTDTCGLYDRYSNMASDYQTIKIVRNGISGSYSYSITGGYSEAANCPVFDVSWGSAARFCNWLQNGQPTGVQGPGTTETGAYTLDGAVSDAALMAITRNPGATYVIPTEDEWYKAAYYKGGSTNAGYWTYPTKSNSQPINALSSTGTNNANFYRSSLTSPSNYLTPVGAFAASPGPYGTFDMGGDVWQWNEANIAGLSRGLRGGSWANVSYYMTSSYRGENQPSNEGYDVGFRVASLATPEPGSLALLALAGLCSAAFLVKRRR